MALPVNALCTVAQLEEELGLPVTTAGTAPAYLERLVATASQAIEDWCGRRLSQDSAALATLVGNGKSTIQVPHTPLVTVVGVAFDGVTQSSGTFKLGNAGAGLVELKNGATFPLGSVVTVNYVGGYMTAAQTAVVSARTLPASLEHACIATAVALYRARGRDGSIASESLGDYSVTYRGGNTAIGSGQGGIIPDSVLPLLRPFKRWR